MNTVIKASFPRHDHSAAPMGTRLAAPFDLQMKEKPTMDRSSQTNSHGPAGEESARPTSARDAKERAGELWDDAKEAARATLNVQKHAAAEGIDDVAAALRDAARRRQHDGKSDAYAALGGTAADGLDRLAQTLRSKDLGTMVRDVEDFARRQPVVFFGLALAAGFVGARAIKASAPSTQP
jgi:hypothetical protein